jgi:hypothetical protein
VNFVSRHPDVLLVIRAVLVSFFRNPLWPMEAPMDDAWKTLVRG